MHDTAERDRFGDTAQSVARVEVLARLMDGVLAKLYLCFERGASRVNHCAAPLLAPTLLALAWRQNSPARRQAIKKAAWGLMTGSVLGRKVSQLFSAASGALSGQRAYRESDFD